MVNGGSARLRPLTAVWALVVACSVGGCLGGGSGQPGASATNSPASTVKLSGARRASVRDLPWVGRVVIASTTEQGLTIRDRATGGRKFFLSDIQAGECLDFLRANPAPTRQAMQAACPGRTP